MYKRNVISDYTVDTTLEVWEKFKRENGSVKLYRYFELVNIIWDLSYEQHNTLVSVVFNNERKAVEWKMRYG